MQSLTEASKPSVVHAADLQRMINKQDVVGLSFTTAMVYIPEYFQENLDRGLSPFFSRKSRIVASGENISRVVRDEERRTGKPIDSLSWGSDSVLRRNVDGSWPSVEFNIHAASRSRSVIVFAAYQTIYDGSHEIGRARQFLVEYGRLTENRIRLDKGRGPELRSGLESLGRQPDGSYATYVAGDKVKGIIDEDPYGAPAIMEAIREANGRYARARGAERSRTGVDRDR